MPRQGKTAERGYDNAHRRRREAALADLKRNPGQPCSRCRRPMYVEQELHLDHDDDDRRRYRGLSHAFCNEQAGARARERRRAQREARPPLPSW